MFELQFRKWYDCCPKNRTWGQGTLPVQGWICAQGGVDDHHMLIWII